MGSALAGLLILSLMLTSFMMFWRVSLLGNDRISTAQKQIMDVKGGQARTIPNITAAAGNRNENSTLQWTWQLGTGDWDDSSGASADELGNTAW